MMETYGKTDIQELPLGTRFFRNKAEAFLAANNLRLEDVDVYLTVQDSDGQILAGGGLSKDIIKCVAVAPQARSLGLAAPLVSELISRGFQSGYKSLKVFTKPENLAIFQSLGFSLIGSAPKAILLESSLAPVTDYLTYLCSLLPADSSIPKPSRSARPHHSLALMVPPLPRRGRHGFWDGKSAGHEGLCRSEMLSFRPESDGPKSLSFRPEAEGRSGEISINANPFTLGHRYLIEKAAAQVDRLYIIVVKEDVSRFPYEERLAMVTTGCSDIPNVTVCEGSAYQISSATFPTYFLKEKSDATDTQILLDLDIFASHIAPALGATVRFVGSEPYDALTARYNALMKEVLPARGIEVAEIDRLPAISASAVREALDQGSFAKAASMVPETTYPYLLADLAVTSLKKELDTPLKPGLVGPEGPGAHSDMDYGTMQSAIAALRPFFVSIAFGPDCHLDLSQESNHCHFDLSQESDHCHFDLSQESDYCHFDRAKRVEKSLSEWGLAAEAEMRAATGGVNTHQGAIFALGLTIASIEISRLTAFARNDSEISRCARQDSDSDSVIVTSTVVEKSQLSEAVASLAAGIPETQRSLQWKAMGLMGPLSLAREGYKPLFQDWLPYYKTVKSEEFGIQKTLLRIMSTLDDTCIVRRAGLDRARQVKMEASALLGNFSEEALQKLCKEFESDGISPGGAADMLALTIFVESIENNNKS